MNDRLTAATKWLQPVTVAVVLTVAVIVLTAVLSAGAGAVPIMSDGFPEQNNTTTQATSTSPTPSRTTDTGEGLFTGGSSATVTGGVAGTPNQQTEARNASKSVLVIGGNGSYNFRVVNNLTGAQTGPEDLVSEYRASGTVNGSERDIYVFDYGLMDFTSNGSIRVTLNGNPIDQQVLNGHRLAIYKDPPETENGTVEYEVSVSGIIAPSALGNQTQIVDNNTARGTLAPYDGITAFYYSGEITQFNVVGDVQVTLDNEPTDPEDVAAVSTPAATTQSPTSAPASTSNTKQTGADGTGGTDGADGTPGNGPTTGVGTTAASSGSGPGFGHGSVAVAIVLSLAAIGIKTQI
jgi:hypothetical protein